MNNNRTADKFALPDFCFAGFGDKHLTTFESLRERLDNSEISYRSIISPEQVYSDFVREVSDTADPFLRVHRTDALVTQTPGLVLTVKTADCLPILFAEPHSKTIGIAHCGWRGSFLQIARNVVTFMATFGAEAKNIRVAIGPGIHSCCYDIHGNRLTDFMQMFPEWKNEFLRKTGEKTHIDLVRLNTLQLVRAGVLEKNIHIDPSCTADDTKYLSYVRGDRGENMIHYIGIL